MRSSALLPRNRTRRTLFHNLRGYGKGYGVSAAVLCVAGIVLWSGCGATSHTFLVNTAGRTIYVDEVKNAMNVAAEANDYAHYRSVPPGLEKELKAEIISRLQTEGYLKIVNSKETADIVLVAEITDYLREAVSIRDEHQIDDYRLVMGVNATFYKGAGGPAITRISFSTDSTYDLRPELVRDNATALQFLLSKTARKIADALLDQW